MWFGFYFRVYTKEEQYIYKDNGILDSTLFYGAARYEKQDLIRKNKRSIRE